MAPTSAVLLLLAVLAASTSGFEITTDAAATGAVARSVHAVPRQGEAGEDGIREDYTYLLGPYLV